jgi:hypothetical protein
MKFRKGFEHSFSAERKDENGGEPRFQHFSLQTMLGDSELRMIVTDRFGDTALVRLTEEQAEELAVALTYALTSDDNDTPTEGQ